MPNTITKKLSIIIPCYNAASTLEACLRSISEQTFKDYEVLLIDGDSKDGCQEIAAKHLHILSYFVSEKDSGVYEAINKGLDKSRGDWIYILGADDQLYDSRVLEKVGAHFSSHSALLYGDVENTSRISGGVPAVHHSAFDNGLYWRNRLHQQGAFYRRDLFEKFRFNASYKILADYDFHLMLYAKGISTESLGITVATCEAQGLSKNFSWDLYSEELTIKRQRLSSRFYLINLIWVRIKFLYKKLA